MLNVHLKLHDKHSVSLYVDLSEKNGLQALGNTPMHLDLLNFNNSKSSDPSSNLASSFQHTYNLINASLNLLLLRNTHGNSLATSKHRDQVDY